MRLEWETDAPVHSIAAALFLKPEEIHYFKDFGCTSPFIIFSLLLSSQLLTVLPSLVSAAPCPLLFHAPQTSTTPSLPARRTTSRTERHAPAIRSMRTTSVRLSLLLPFFLTFISDVTFTLPSALLLFAQTTTGTHAVTSGESCTRTLERAGFLPLPQFSSSLTPSFPSTRSSHSQGCTDTPSPLVVHSRYPSFPLRRKIDNFVLYAPVSGPSRLQKREKTFAA
jgi:hypothetical protein